MGDALLGRTLGGKYTLESLLGTGAMGAVYRARHVVLDAVVAVKVMHDDIAVDHTFAERFHREARAASRLDHPNVIRVVDFGLEPDGHLYIVMEYVEGYDLFQVIRRDSPLSEARTIDLLAQAMSGIAAAHDMGVVHRDLKPENIMVATRIGDDGAKYEIVKVCDFGIAQITEPERASSAGGTHQRTLTARGVLLGTPQYMSPEQARGEVTDARTDVYSLGVILYQLLTGQLPFDGPTPIDTVLKHISEDPLPPSEVVPSASPRLEAVCMKALAKRREGRWGSAREMRAALRSERTSTPSGRPTDPASIQQRSPSAREPLTGIARSSPNETVAPHETMPSFRRGPTRGALYVIAACVLLVLGGWALVAGQNDGEHRVTVSEPVPKVTPARGEPRATPPEEPTKGAPSSPSTPDVATLGPLRPSKSGGVRRNGAKPGEPAVPRVSDDRNVTSEVAENSRAAALAARPTEAPPVTAASIPSPESERATPHPASPPSSPERSAPEVRAPEPFAVHSSALRVKWHVAQVGGGATSGDVTRSLSRAAPAWNGCYESGLRSRGRRVEGQGTLRLSCDDQGRVVTATFSGTGMSDVAACVQSSVTGITIPNADTGEAWATVSVTLAIAD